MPAVLVVLAMSIFPLLVSLYLSLARFKFVKGGFQLKFVGLLNYKKLLLGSEQFHFLGTFGELSAAGWAVLGVVAVGLIASARPLCPGVRLHAARPVRAQRGERGGVSSRPPDRVDQQRRWPPRAAWS